METTRLYLANGLTRVVKGNAKDVGGILKARTMGADDGLRQLQTIDGDWLTINREAVAMVEKATATKTTRTFGFARALEAA